jgi:diacylglycerol kinase family enzyme
MLPALMRGRHLGHAQVQTLSFLKLQLQAREPVPLAADGEALQAADRVQVRLHPATLQVVGRGAGPSSAAGSV